MTATDAIQTAVDQLPAIHQHACDYRLISQTDYRDVTVFTFVRKPVPYPISQPLVTVTDNRLSGKVSASYVVA